MIEVKSIKNLTAGVRSHKAMPALASTKDGKLLIAFREGSDHVDSADGHLELLASDDGEKWDQKTLVPESPKFDIRVDHGMTRVGEDVILPYQEVSYGWNIAKCRYVILTSKDGETWTELFAGRRANFFPYGRIHSSGAGTLFIPGYKIFSYRPPIFKPAMLILSERVRAYIRGFDTCESLNEMDVCKLEDGFLAIAREEGKRQSFRMFSEDLKSWAITRLPFAVQSPSLLKVKDRILLAGREVRIFRNKFGAGVLRALGTSVRESSDLGKTWSEPLMINCAHAWDHGYPSLLEHDGRILCAFYSEFVYGNSDIMLAEMEVN